MQEVDIPLTPAAIGDLLSRREIYRRTAYLVLRGRGQTALVAVRPEDPDRLFSPVAELRVLSGPATTAWIDEPETDVGNATSLAAAALAHHRDGLLAYVVRGRFEHVNFIWRPAPLTILVTEVIPPHPAKLLAMAEQVVGYDEDLPPVSLALDAVDVRELVAANPAAHYLLPCRGGGLPAGRTSASSTATRRITRTGCSSAASGRGSSTSTSTAASPGAWTCARGPGPPRRPELACSPSAACWNAVSRSAARRRWCRGGRISTRCAPRSACSAASPRPWPRGHERRPPGRGPGTGP